MDSDLEQIAVARSEARGHPVAVVQIGDGEAAVLDYDDASKPYPSDTTSDEWQTRGRRGALAWPRSRARSRRRLIDRPTG